MVVPVVPGPDGATPSMSDGPDAWCAACGQSWAPRTRRTVSGVLLMLCDDVIACVRTYRRGLTPAAFGEQLRNPAYAIVTRSEWEKATAAS